MAQKIELKISPNPNSALAKMANATGFGSSEVSKYDKDRAVSIANHWLKKRDEKEKKDIEKYVTALLNLWKYDHGKPRANTLAGILGGQEEKLSDDDRILKIADLEPWDAAPIWIRTPLELWIHVWSSDYREGMTSRQYYDGLAWLVVFSDQKEIPSWWPSMITSALRISDVQIDLFDSLKESYSEDLKKLLPSAKAKSKQNKNLLQNDPDFKAFENRRIKELKDRIHSLATNYLEQKKDKRCIISLMKKHGNLNKSERQIRIYLEDHASGKWTPKRQKKKN